MAIKEWSVLAIESAVREAFGRLGYPDVRDEQLEAAREFLRGRDVFVSLPTGSGKSLCYGCLPFAFNSLRKSSSSIMIVISPLKTLMLDQMEIFNAKGVQAIYVGDELDVKSMDNVKSGKCALLFISPEVLIGGCTWRELLQSQIYQENLIAVVVDEAHCVEKWGKTFRTEFSRIAEIRSLIPHHVHMMALTATAVVSTRRKIIGSLNMKKVHIVSRNPRKENITYLVKEKPTDIADILSPIVDDILENNRNAERTIIFCRNFEDCADMYHFFKSKLRRKLYYPTTAPPLSKFRLVDMFTSVTEESVKRNILTNFTDPTGLCRVVVGTIAFGMGLDSPNVRKVIHWGPSSDLESYVQESGRAGRDGKPSTCTLYFEKSELNTARHVSSAMIGYIKNTTICRKDFLFRDFDQVTCKDKQFTPCTCCDICK